MRQVLLTAMGVLLLTGLLVGCASAPKPIPQAFDDEFAGAPAWVKSSCSAYLAEKAKDEKDAPAAICAVGSMTGTRNVSLARTGATARARTELARTLDTHVKAMIKDYQATTTGGEEFKRAANDEQSIADVAKQITDMNLSGTELADTWVSKNATYYVLIVLDIDKFKNVVGKMQGLSEGIRKAVQDRADKAFKELDQEIDKNKNPAPAAPPPN